MNELVAERVRHQQYPVRFLAAWKKGIELVGGEFFAGNIFSATDKWQLKPKYAVINNAKDKLPRGEMLFLAAMYSFYDSIAAQKWLNALDCPNLADISGALESDQQAIIAELFVTYRGW